MINRNGSSPVIRAWPGTLFCEEVKTDMRYDVVIIGGGASGLMLAANLDMRRWRGIILEKTGSLGTKLLMSGGGRCNITRGGSIKDFIKSYGESGPALRKCLYRHSNKDLAGWFSDNGIELADEKGNIVRSEDMDGAGRLFPASMRASDILNLMLKKSKENGWEILADSEVYALTAPADDSDCWKVDAAGEELTASSVVVASGGITFPETGSDGSVFKILRNLGVEVTDVRSALAPVYVENYPYEELSGISLSDVTVTAFSSDAVNTCKGKAARMTGDLLFTHRGFSGPVILNISRYAEKGELLRIQYNREFSDLPKRLQRAIEKRAMGPSGDVRTKTLALLLDHDDFTVSSVDENGMVTSGGIALDEIDMSTMQIRRFPGLYAAGEAIDADGITGGYNLQLCWSTACTAADAIRSSIRPDHLQK